MANQTLNVPPFPPLDWDDYFWKGEVVLPSWAGFQARRGLYASVSSPATSDGRVGLTVAPQSEDVDRRTRLLPEQVRAFQLLLDSERSVGDAVLRAIFLEYPALRDAYGLDDDVMAEVMPEIERPEQLRMLIGLATVHLLSQAREGIAFIGFEFGCTWEEEHGLGVMTHKDRVLEVGAADTSFSAPNT
jgi:hypothetical protein